MEQKTKKQKFMLSAFIQGMLGGAIQQATAPVQRSRQHTIEDRVGSMSIPVLSNQQHRNPNSTSGLSRVTIRPMCPHNDRGETSIADVIEHVGNGDFGSAARDVAESSFGQAVAEVARDATQTIGDSMMRDGN